MRFLSIWKRQHAFIALLALVSVVSAPVFSFAQTTPRRANKVRENGKNGNNGSPSTLDSEASLSPRSIRISANGSPSEDDSPAYREDLPEPLTPRGNGPEFSDREGRELVDRDGPELELVEFRDQTLSEVAKLLADQSGLKLVPSAEAGKRKVTLYLRNVRPGVVVDAITKTNDMFYREDPSTGVIRIYTTEEYQKDLGSFREEETQVFTLLYPNPLDVAFAIRGAFGDRVRLSLNGQQVNAQDFQDLIQRFARFNLVDQQNRQSNTFGFGSGSQGATGQFGGNQFNQGFGFGNQGFGNQGFGNQGLGGAGLFGNSFGIGGQFGGNAFGQPNPFNQNASQLPQSGAQRLEDLSPEQIQSLESNQSGAVDTLLRSRKSDIFVAVVMRNNQLIVRTADARSMQRVTELVRSLDVPTPLVLLEVQVLALDLRDDFRSAFDYQWTDGTTSAGGFNTDTNQTNGFTTGNILPPAADVLGPPRTSPIAPGAVGALPANNMTFQVVSSNFRFRLQLLESKNRVTQLAAPIILTANNEVSRIFIGRTVPIVTGYSQSGVVGVGVGQATTLLPTPITTLQNIGQSLLISPNINADRTVTLRVAQETSAIDAKASIPVVVTGSSTTGTTTTASLVDAQIDTVRRSTVTGTVVAQDGYTVAIGGLIEENLSDARKQVPVLGKLPVVGIMFRGQNTGKSRRELVVLIRPYVFNTPQESALVSRDVVSELSAHPHAPDALGTLNSFAPQEILTADPPETPLQTIFRLHSIRPKIY